MLELIERDRDGTWEMRRSIFVSRPYVDDHQRLTGPQPGQQLLPAHGFKPFSRS